MESKSFTQNILFCNKRCTVITLTFILIACSIFISPNLVIKRREYDQARSVITTLIRSNDRSISLTINMIHSVLKFHAFNTTNSYPFIIFHDQNFTTWMRKRILSCVLQSHPQARIAFAPVDFQTLVQPSNTSRLKKSMGYRLMCRFWTYDVFYHPAIFQQGYDYLMRMDDDSYFSDQVSEDLFLYMDKHKLDYIYRATYSEPITPMASIIKRYFHGRTNHEQCIYNNFFIMRLKWFYESKRVQSFIQELLIDNLILREYIGDGCVHAAMLKIDDQVKSARLTHIPYGHNYHSMPSKSKKWLFHLVDKFYEEVNKSCHQLTVLQGYSGRLTKIKM